MSKTYIGFSRDHSISMSRLAEFARKDYNENISIIKEQSIVNFLDTIISVVKCGDRSNLMTGYNNVSAEHLTASVTTLRPLDHYDTSGGNTPLFDSVMALIHNFESVPDANSKDVSFLVMVTTDGDENASRVSGTEMSRKIRQLQETGRWTFVFRVPKGHSASLTRYGIPAGNVVEWDQTAKGVETISRQTQEAFTQYFTNRGKGITGTEKFYTDLSSVSIDQVKGNLIDISSQVSIWPVSAAEDGSQIRPFVEGRLGHQMLKGAAFYQLSKAEKQVQDYKLICIRDKKTGSIYGGAAARQLLGLPSTGTIKLEPGNHGNYEIFIQSTSVNRKLVGGTQLLYWANVGTSINQGPTSGPASMWTDYKSPTGTTQPAPVPHQTSQQVATAPAKTTTVTTTVTKKAGPQRDSKGRFVKKGTSGSTGPKRDSKGRFVKQS